MSASLFQASALIEAFRAGSLRATVASIETALVAMPKDRASQQLAGLGVGPELLSAALLIKKHSSQIDEIIHTIGILLALPNILEPDEIVESISLAAGNTGKGFDLETNHRIAEFTFIQWQGGSEVIRQNKIFKDFFFLAEADIPKKKELYTVGTQHPKKFFQSRRALAPILANNRKLGDAFKAKYGGDVRWVRDYYTPRASQVAICDVTNHIPALRTSELPAIPTTPTAAIAPAPQNKSVGC